MLAWKSLKQEQAITQAVITNSLLKENALKKAAEDRISTERETQLKLADLNKNYYENNLTVQQQYGNLSVEEKRKKRTGTH